MAKFVRMGLCTLLLAAPPLMAQASSCASGASLASVIAAGSCTLGDLTLDFSQPSQGSTTYYPGPYAGSSGNAPAASSVLFSTDVSDPDKVSFTLGLPLLAMGGYSYIPGKGIILPGSYYNMQLSYLKVYSTATRGLAGYSVELINPVNYNPAGASYNGASASLNSASSYIQGDGSLQAKGSDLVDPPIFDGLKYFALYGQAYNYSSDTTSYIGFDGIKVSFDVVSSVPEPDSWALLLLGLGVTAGAVRRRTRQAARPGLPR